MGSWMCQFLLMAGADVRIANEFYGNKWLVHDLIMWIAIFFALFNSAFCAPSFLISSIILHMVATPFSSCLTYRGGFDKSLTLFVSNVIIKLTT